MLWNQLRKTFILINNYVPCIIIHQFIIDKIIKKWLPSTIYEYFQNSKLLLSIVQLVDDEIKLYRRSAAIFFLYTIKKQKEKIKLISIETWTENSYVCDGLDL